MLGLLSGAHRLSPHRHAPCRWLPKAHSQRTLSLISNHGAAPLHGIQVPDMLSMPILQAYLFYL